LFILKAHLLCATSAHSFFPPHERAHSLQFNKIGTHGARSITEALKSNATVTYFECVSLFFSFSLTPASYLRATEPLVFLLFEINSLSSNDIGTAGALSVAEALGSNVTLKELQ
jgi:hypothetical protein